MKKLIVIAQKDAQGNALTTAVKPSSRNAEWGQVAVMTEELSLKNGVINKAKRVGYIHAKLEHLNAMNLNIGDDFNIKGAKAGLPAMEIIVKETTTPQFEGQEAKINPTTGAKVLSAEGTEIFRSSVVVVAGTETDTLVASTPATIAATTANSVEQGVR